MVTRVFEEYLFKPRPSLLLPVPGLQLIAGIARTLYDTTVMIPRNFSQTLKGVLGLPFEAICKVDILIWS